MALFLAFSETLGKSAQIEAVNLNIKASLNALPPSP
jgi:hypothetical protein